MTQNITSIYLGLAKKHTDDCHGEQMETLKDHRHNNQHIWDQVKANQNCKMKKDKIFQIYKVKVVATSS